MWSDAGDAGYSYGGGAGGDEDVFGTQQFSSPAGKKSQGRRIESNLPMTISSVLQLSEDNPEYYGTEVKMVTVIGVIREIEVSSTKMSYLVSDSTGSIKVIKWVDSDAETESLMENTYCRVHGTIKTYDGNKQLLALHLEPITDLNWVTSHILEVIHTVMQLKKLQIMRNGGGAVGGDGMMMGGGAAMGRNTGVLSNSLVGYDPSGVAGGVSTLSRVQNSVHNIIKNCHNTEGCAKDEIKMQLKGQVTPKQLEETLTYLSNEGYIYTTTDDEHFNATDA